MQQTVHVLRAKSTQSGPRLWLLAWFAVLYFLLIPAAHATHKGTMVIAAANSTCSAIRAVGAAFSTHNDIKVEYICKSSGRLAKGLIGGAIHADYYISANAKWMTVMVEADQVDQGAVQNLWGNELVVATPKHAHLAVTKLPDLASDTVQNVYIGDPSTAPFGRYAKQALQSQGIWENVKPKIITQKHITLLAQNLSHAQVGTTGILFSTNVTPELHVQLKIDANLHDPIHYFSAPLVKPDERVWGDRFAQFLKTEPAQNIFRKHGFKIVP